MNIFKAYDIRGIYPQEIDKNTARKIAFNFGQILPRKATVVVGYDMRPHSLPLKDAFLQGLMEAGQDVILIGLCSTPMMNFATSFLGAIGGVMITASHNSKEWNGFKFCGENSTPISYNNGISQIEQMFTEEIIPAKTLGSIRGYDISLDYAKTIRKKISPFSQKPKIVIDYANAMGIKEVEGILDYFNVIPLFDNYDGTFPNHEANPLKNSTLIDLQKEILSSKADFGAALDGDADRCGFVDELGHIIPMDIISALIAQQILQNQKGAVVFDVRSSNAVTEIILANGGIPIKSAVGHSNMKKAMRDNNAIFGGELSGHYYFPDFANCESQAFTILIIGQIITEANKPLSQLVAPILKYAKSEEINFKVDNTKQTIKRILKKFSKYKKEEIDGVTILADNWWFNVRSSNTEPLLRLNIEANSPEKLTSLIEELTQLIKS